MVQITISKAKKCDLKIRKSSKNADSIHDKVDERKRISAEAKGI